MPLSFYANPNMKADDTLIDVEMEKNQREIPSADLAQTIIKPVTVTDGFSHVDQVIMTIMTVNDSSNKGINPE